MDSFDKDNIVFPVFVNRDGELSDPEEGMVLDRFFWIETAYTSRSAQISSQSLTILKGWVFRFHG